MKEKNKKKTKKEELPYIPLDELSKKYGNPYKIVLDAAKKAQSKFNVSGEIDNNVIIETLKELLEKDENRPRNNR